MPSRPIFARLRRHLAVTALGVGALAFTAIPVDAQDRIRWRVPIAFPSALPALGDNMPWVAEQLAAATDGRIEFRVVEPGEMVPALELSEAVGQGQIQAGYNWLGYDQGRIPASPLFSAVPFGMEPWEYIAWWKHGGGQTLAEEIYGAINVMPLFCGITGPETAGWFKAPIESVEDLRGLRIRFAGLGGQVIASLGASVSLIPGGEIFQSLERGVIDGAEFALPIVDQRLGFHRVAPYNLFPGWHQPFTAFHFIVNLDTWNALSSADQALIRLACQAGVMNNLADSEGLQGEVIAGFPDIGVTAGVLPEEVLRELQAATEIVLAEQAAADADFARVFESQREFSAMYRYWKELGYLPRDF
ncbi:MAG: TRAP transporter substrate-binding protein [Geminicoccaceae bacterium]|nr:MAG: TRAP transporter substrate-binding protein [Geminicoccaceae bacterium]